MKLRRFKSGDIVEHPTFGIGTVVSSVYSYCDGKEIDNLEYSIDFLISNKKTRWIEESTLTSRPDLRKTNDEGRRWCKPPIGVHKPYRNKNN